tara:strand:+ start:129 stop:368 length:240 start_codon:yes stop_codon:yes gene_type:complete
MKCFDAYEKHKIQCDKCECRHHIKNPDSMNCTIIAAKRGPMTLQQIGDIFGVTRMRICQIEKRIIKKMESIVGQEPDLH